MEISLQYLSSAVMRLPLNVNLYNSALQLKFYFIQILLRPILLGQREYNNRQRGKLSGTVICTIHEISFCSISIIVNLSTGNTYFQLFFHISHLLHYSQRRKRKRR